MTRERDEEDARVPVAVQQPAVTTRELRVQHNSKQECSKCNRDEKKTPNYVRRSESIWSETSLFCHCEEHGLRHCLVQGRR